MKILKYLAIGLAIAFSAGADDVIVPKNSGNAYIKDAGGDLVPLNIAYTTDGNGHLKLINSSNPVDDSLTIPKNSGKMYLNGADGNLYPALVLYTTDGSGNVMPIPSGGGGGGSGTVTSVGLADGSTTPIFNITNSPVTVAGTLTETLATQGANTVLAGPTTGSAAQPTFRAIVPADIPTLNQNTTGTAANVTATANSTLVTLSALALPYSQLTGSAPIWNQNTTGTAANITATSNSTLTTLSALSLPGSQVTGNISGNAANVTGTVAIANGGTGQTSASAAFNALSPLTTLGDTLYGGASGAGTRLAGNTTSTKNFLVQTGTGSVSAAPSWGTIQVADVPTLNQNTTGTASNITASSNSTLTTLSALSLPGSQVSGNISGNSANVTGTVAIANGGTGQTTAPNAINALLPSQTGNSGKVLSTNGSVASWGSAGGNGTVTSVGLVDSTGTFNITNSPVTTTGNLTLASYASQSANTFLAAPNGSSGAPTFRTIVAADVPTLNQNTTGTAANITATSNSTLTTLSALSLPGSQVTGNISGNAANVTGVVAIANGGTNNSSAYTAGSIPYSNGTSLTQDNANLNWSDSNTALGIGTTPQSGSLITVQNSSGAAKPIWAFGYGTGSTVGLRGDMARGTAGSPTATQSGDVLDFISGRGYGASQFAANATGVMQIVAGENFTNTSNATYMAFKTTPTASVTSAEAMRINSTGDVLIGTTTDSGTQLLQVNGNSNVGTVTAGTWNGTTVAIAHGGTGQTTANAAFNALSPMTTLGDIEYENATPAGARLAGNTTSTKNFLTQTGNGTISAAPAWGVLASADIPNNAANTTGTASNVTGVVAVANGGTSLSATSAYSVLSNNTATANTLASNQSLILGTPAFTDTGTLGQLSASTNGYEQFILNNTNAGAAASTDFIVNNDQGTASTHYGDFGINSSGFTGSGSINIPGATYLYSQNGDLVLGTNTSNAMHFFTNGATTDAMSISSAGNVTLAGTANAVGTITSGIWNGTTIAIANGGTNATTVSGARTNLGIDAGVSLVTSGTTYTTPSSITTATTFKFTLVGGGGGGGGIATNNDSGAGGGGGATCEIALTGLSPSTAYTIAIGAAGSAGTTTPSAGGSGGNTTLTVGATTYTAGGGTGGADTSQTLGGAGGACTNTTINVNGHIGGASPRSNTSFMPADGGSSMFGMGGAGGNPSTGSAGSAGTGYGAGGGAGNDINTPVAGGAGTAGAIIVEYWN